MDANGRSWRSGAVVQQKMLKQWFFRITDYAEDLLRDVQALEVLFVFDISGRIVSR